MLRRTLYMAFDELWRNGEHDSPCWQELHWKRVLCKRWNCKWYVVLILLINIARCFLKKVVSIFGIFISFIIFSSAMQDQLGFFYSQAGQSANVVDDLISPNEKVRNKAASLYREWIERRYQNADAKEYDNISVGLFILLSRLNRTTDENAHLGYLALINELVDLGYQEEERNVRMSTFLESDINSIRSDKLLEPLSSVRIYFGC